MDKNSGDPSEDRESLIPKHGGYRNLKSFQLAQLAYDVTVRFCDRYVGRAQRRMQEQMVQAARSGVQNIAEGSQASGTSKKTELKLTNVARASLEELRLDYEDFLRQRGLNHLVEHARLLPGQQLPSPLGPDLPASPARHARQPSLQLECRAWPDQRLDISRPIDHAFTACASRSLALGTCSPTSACLPSFSHASSI